MAKPTYKNSKGQVYFFREVTGKRGTQIVCSQKESADDLAAIPDSHEIVESPNGQVSCRKKVEREILPEEVALANERAPVLVRKGMKIFVEVKKNELVIHAKETSGLEDIARQFPMANLGTLLHLGNNIPFDPVLKFDLLDKKKRTFLAYRMCWMGGVSDWLYLSEGMLPVLLKKYVRHIGKESFYELM
jgi:hypothetical protein